MFHEGQQIGLYTLIRKIGKGGFGEVWLAERKSKFVTTKVAVKLPLDDQVDHEAIKQEATLWEQASGHPNILPIIDADEYDGQIVIVSEYAPDGSLEQWLKQNGKMPVEKAVETTIQILDGLEFLHSRKIIHRDLKPANILLQGNTARLADFGISRALRTTVSSQSSNVSGTFAYMSPESFDGKRSVQTDVWSAGVNLYQFLTGNLPFPQKEPSILITAILMRDFEPLPAGISQSLKIIITKALAKQPVDRYRTASEMREDLRRVWRGADISNLAQPNLPLTRQFVPDADIPPTQYVNPNPTHRQEFQFDNTPNNNDVPETATILQPVSNLNFQPVQAANPAILEKKDKSRNSTEIVSILSFAGAGLFLLLWVAGSLFGLGNIIHILFILAFVLVIIGIRAGYRGIDNLAVLEKKSKSHNSALIVSTLSLVGAGLFLLLWLVGLALRLGRTIHILFIIAFVLAVIGIRAGVTHFSSNSKRS